jgi:hypothetical protein
MGAALTQTHLIDIMDGVATESFLVLGECSGAT